MKVLSTDITKSHSNHVLLSSGITCMPRLHPTHAGTHTYMYLQHFRTDIRLHVKLTYASCRIVDYYSKAIVLGWADQTFTTLHILVIHLA